MKFDIGSCSACGEDHEQLESFPLINDPNGFEFLAHCPTTGKEVFIKGIFGEQMSKNGERLPIIQGYLRRE